jgi:predicted TIM-barrel fold metal-dependent hydrolase
LTPTVPGPLPAASAPTALAPPAKACDAHCHVFGPAARFPFSPNRTYTPPDSGIDEFIDLQDRLGLTRAVFVQASCHGTDNSAMLDAIGRGNGRFAGVAMIDDSYTDDDLQQLHEAQVRGIRFNFVAHLGGAPDLDRFWRLIRRIEPLGWHVVLHFDAKDLPRYGDLLAAMPVPYIIDHMARVQAVDGIDQEPFRALLKLVEDDERCWVKISCAERLTDLGPAGPYDDVVPFARALIDIAADRVLWGTDWPHPNLKVMPDEGHLLDLLARFCPDETTRNQILVDNPTTLYSFTD